MINTLGQLDQLSSKYLYIHTFGCQMNDRESEQMIALMSAAGYERTSRLQKADLIILNTCSIRQKADQKVYSELGRFRELKEANPELVIAVGGCLAQQRGHEIFKKAPQVDVVFGTRNIHRLPELVAEAAKTGAKLVATSLPERIESLSIATVPPPGRVGAYVTIMQGCNNFCSYCVVPNLRGREISRPAGEIVSEIRALAANGIREVTLLGQNVNSYEAKDEAAGDFAGLLQEIDGVEGVERIRFTTSHPKDLSERLIDSFGRLTKLCEHIHLPVQSGSDFVLRGMNRNYTAEIYATKVAALRRACPGISVTSDMIVGFPGESDEDFQKTIDLMEKIRFDNLFSFAYSEREGTKAATFKDRVPEVVKRERLRTLQSLQEAHTLEKNKRFEGKVEEVLVEAASKKSSADLMGRTRTNRIVNFTGDGRLTGKTVSVRIKEAFLHSLRGEIDGVTAC
ncbi:MAG: tRNA (N6-isopentenyl adenosine(37)-C2)-methylthiotransferase MiaB [Smithellaceae bacterium]|nr:tRNA (N6-isopentenyl adenosine(37)-C2)-methylthiotransferase MiaB [Smithellaceae bacterium]